MTSASEGARLAHEPLEPRTLGQYDVLGVLGSGGMATVHFGRIRGAEGFSRIVAIKRMHPQLARDRPMVDAFVDEARLASRIRHPNVVPVLDIVATDTELLLVMEYVEGEALSRLTYVGKPPLPPAIAVSVFVGVLSGLHAAHEARDERGTALELVHRDVTPHNILVGVDGLAHLVDFGIAKATGRRQETRDGILKGTLPYMAPEQLRSEKVTRLADIYTASVALWEALTGRRLFAANANNEVLVQILGKAVPPPSEFTPDVPRQLDEVVLRGLARDRSRRFPTARAMAQELERALTPASPSQVADWLRGTAGAGLQQRSTALEAGERRARLEAEAEAAREPATTPYLAPSPAASRVPPSSKSRPAVLVVGLLALFSAAAAVAGLAVRETARSPETVPSAPPSGPPSTSTAETTGEPPTADSQTATPASASPSSGAPHIRRVARPPAPNPNPATAGCDPPYTIESGHKVWKKWCL